MAKSKLDQRMSTRQQRKASVKKLASLNQLELDYIQEKHIEGLLNMPFRKRLGFGLRIIFRKIKMTPNQEG